MPKKLLLCLAFIGLAGCQTLAIPANLEGKVLIPEGSELYQEAFVHGCNSGSVSSGNSGKYRKLAVYNEGGEYTKAWNEGFKACADNTEATQEIQRALTLANLPTDLDAVELINYFSFDGHKAFAINPDRRANFWWAYRVGSEEDARRQVLNKCGTNCKLFALNNVIVWEGERFEVPAR